MNKKGLTLLEIILAFTILSIIALAFLTGMSRYIAFIYQGKDMTEVAFSAQKEIEEKIEAIKASIVDGNEPDSSIAEKVTPSITLFEGTAYERVVNGYKTEATISGSKKIVTIVASEQIVYPVPEINNLQLVLQMNNITQSKNYEYVTKPNISLRGTFDLSDPEGVFLVNRHEWFVSRKGFTIPMETDDNLITEGEVGRLYPVFPNDYELIPILSDTNQLSHSDLSALLNEYAGRHIIYTVSPYAMSGKKGKTIFSQPIYLHGPTVTNGLVLHLDASLVSKDPTKSNIDTSGDSIKLNQWNDLSGNNNHVSRNGSAFSPILNEEQYQDDVFAWGKSLSQNGSNNTILTRPSLTNSPSTQMTFIIVAKINGVNANSSIVSGGNWSFGWDNNGELTFKVGSSAPASASSGMGIDDKWHVFTGVFTGVKSGSTVKFRIDGSHVSSGTAASSIPIQSSPFSINFKNAEIAEILIYNNVLNESTDLLEVESYLINKYDPNPEDIMSSILFLKAIPPQTVLKNDTFTPPNPVDAMMTNGTIQKVFVNWNDVDSVDTSTIGTYNITGNAVLDSTKTVNLTVNVVGISSLKRHENPLIIERGTPVTLPGMLDAYLSNGETKKVAVRWSSNSTNLSFSDNILIGNAINTYLNGITATAVLDADISVSYDVQVVKFYTVRFVDWDNNTLIKEETVPEGGFATAPSDPIRVGHIFTGWDKSFNNVTDDLVVKAQYTPITYTVRFFDWNGSLLKEQSVPYGSSATPPPNPTRSGYRFTGWSGSYNNVTSNLTITAQYIQTFTVVFRELPNGGRVYKEVTVDYGGSVTPPNDPERSGYRFTGWLPPPPYNNVNSNLTVVAQWEEQSSCPFVYSFDGTQYHFEHEPVPYAMNKAFESTSYGTLRNMKEVDGRYKVRITEYLESETFVNGFNLYVVDYKADSCVKEFVADIYGNPRTVKERIIPISFIDSMGRNWLEEVSTKDKTVTSSQNMYKKGQYTVSYEAIFNKPEDSGDIAKLLIRTKVTGLVDSIGKWFTDIIDGTNNIWWVQEALLASDSQKYMDVFDVATLSVELWDGHRWVNQGNISGGSHLFEEFLVPINLSAIKEKTDKIKIRLVGGAGFFEIDQVSIDFSRDEIIEIKKLDNYTSLLNGSKNVSEIVTDFNDNKRVKLQKGDYIDLYYIAPELREGYKRGYMVEFKGYFNIGLRSNVSPIADSLAEMNLDEIMYTVLREQPEAAETIKVLEWLLELADSAYKKPMEYKVKKIMVDNVLRWLAEGDNYLREFIK